MRARGGVARVEGGGVWLRAARLGDARVGGRATLVVLNGSQSCRNFNAYGFIYTSLVVNRVFTCVLPTASAPPTINPHMRIGPRGVHSITRVDPAINHAINTRKLEELQMELGS